MKRLGGWLAGGRWLGAGLLVLLLALRAVDPAPVQVVRLKLFDFYQQLSPRVETGWPVTIVEIDERSIQALGQWPWPRTLLATIVDRVAGAGAVVIGFDIVFAEPDRLSPTELTKHLPQLPSDVRQSLAGLASNDRVFADSFRRNRVVAARAARTDTAETPGEPLRRVTPAAEIGGNPRPYLYRFAAILDNIEELDAAAAGRGIISLAPGHDGVVRRVPALVGYGDAILPALFMEMLRVATGQKAYAIRVDEAGVAGLVVAGVKIPTARRGEVWVRYRPPVPARSVSAIDIIEGRADPAKFRGKLVLVGASATGLHDIRATPLGVMMPGVEIQAQLLETVLSKSYLTRPHYALGAELSVALVAGLLLLVLVPMMRAGWTMAAVGVVAGGLFVASWYLFSRQSLLLDASYSVFVAVVMFTYLVYTGFRQEERQKRQVRSAFGQYLSPVLVEQLAEHPERLELGGEQRPMTVMFSDIRGFTSISEQFQHDPKGLTRLINRFLTPLTDEVLARRGTIDKYIGDCLMAFWNAPLDDERHAAHACEAALAMFRALARLNDELRREMLGDGAAGESAHADYVMAKRLSEGDGVERDLSKAFELLCREAEQGFANAQYSLGKAYRDGLGVATDQAEAARWFRAAAEQGYAKAQRHLGTRYATGEGVEADDLAALTWLTIAARQGLAAAEEAREALLERVRPSQIAEAERVARVWRPKVPGKRAFRLEAGIGISTGECVVGNMGSTQRFDYSVLGDTVNLASRLEAASKNYGIGIIVGETTRGLAPEFAALELDLIAVKGKSEAVKIYGLIGDPDLAETEAFQALERQHQAMLAAYRGRRWREARARLEQCTAHGRDFEYLYEIYRRRIDVYEADPPGPDWDGVFVAHTK